MIKCVSYEIDYSHVTYIKGCGKANQIIISQLKHRFWASRKNGQDLSHVRAFQEILSLKTKNI